MGVAGGECETRAARRAQFDRFVTREYAGLIAEAVVLLDDQVRAAQLLRRVLARARRDWTNGVPHPDGHTDPADLVRDALIARLGRRIGRARRRDPSSPPALVALRPLPTVQRRALVLRHVLGRSVAQVAVDTGASAETVRSRLVHGAWALAHHHPDGLTPARSDESCPVESWAAAELRALRRTVAARRGRSPSPRRAAAAQAAAPEVSAPEGPQTTTILVLTPIPAPAAAVSL